MKVRIYEEESYPTYGFSDASYDTEVDVPEDTVRDWRRVMAEYQRVQTEMCEALDAIEDD